MRYSLILFALLIQSLAGNAQSVTFLGSTTAPDELKAPSYKKHCNATTAGKITMLAGGVAAAVGIAGLASPWAKEHDEGHSEGVKNATALTVGGVATGVVGVVVYIMGRQVDDNNRKRHISVTSDRNSVGLVYRFK